MLKKLRFTTATVALVMAFGSVLASPIVAEAATGVGVIADTVKPETLAVSDTVKGEIGLKFSPVIGGTLTHVQFYQNASNSGITSASVWSSTGTLLAKVAVNPTGTVGWRTAAVNVKLEAGKTYTASVFDSNSKYPTTSKAFTQAKTVNGITTPANAGVYRYVNASAFPSTGGQGYSFLVDVVFEGAAVTPAPTATATPVPTTPASEPAAPAPVPSPDTETSIPTDTIYGPDGTHWPQNTPRADAARVVNVAASWPAIAEAITANAASTDAVVICVAPGTIAGGSGAGSSAPGVLQNIGNAARDSRILVSACAGTGTVKAAPGSGIAFVGVKGVSIMGIDFSAQPVMIRNSESFAVGYSVIPRLLITANGGNGVKSVEIIEVVAGPDPVYNSTSDRVEIKSADGFDVDGLRFEGFYGAPQYKANGSGAHVDTVQFVTTSSDGVISNVTIEDSALFQSSDQGIMAGGNFGGTLTHSAFFGGTTGQIRYPMYPGGDPIVQSNLLHGTWSSVGVTETVVAGSISPSYTFAEVVGSWSTGGSRGFTALGALTAADIDRLVPMPNAARLASIWG